MDLTPDALREVTFRGALRGYNVQDVDEFVEQVAVGMTELLEQLRLASERAAAAERRVKEVAATEDAMRKTLAHAQTLAEAVLTEAREEAARGIEAARVAGAQPQANVGEEVAPEREAAGTFRAEAAQLLEEAQAARLAAGAEVEAFRAAAQAEIEAERAAALAGIEAERAAIELERAAAAASVEAVVARAAEGIDADLRTEVERLHGVRQALQHDVAVLTSWMDEQRGSVRDGLVETLAALDRAAPIEGPPPTAEVDATVRLAGHPVGAAPASAPTPDDPEAASSPRALEVPEAASSAPPPEVPEAASAAPSALEPELQPEGQAAAEDITAAERPTVSVDLTDAEFLAELKKAAADGDGAPSRPREQGRPS